VPKELRFYDPQTGLKLLSRQEVEQALSQAEQRADRLDAQLRGLGIKPDLF
jgi:hypothetical protein